MPLPIQAITFDFWRTLFYTHVNFQERRDARVRALVAITGCEPADAKAALKAQEQEFLRIHIAEQRTLMPAAAIPLLETHLDTTFCASKTQAICDAIEDVTLEHPPAPIEGALEAVQAAAERVPVGLISDTGLATGKTITQLLENNGFGGLFTSMTFSDETGVAKPQPAMYHHASENLAVPVESLLHIGDLEPTDIHGALSLGAHAALFGGDNDRFVGNTKAHHTFTDWPSFVEKLPELVGR
ncbi:MAG: HAD family hydrolase [Candidatus Hydrogenedentota bacterium]